MPLISLNLPATRNTEMPIATIPAATEQQVDYVMPANIEKMELVFLPTITDLKVARNAVAGTPAGPANADKTPVPAAGATEPFRSLLQRKTGEEGVALTFTFWFYSTTGGKVTGWVR